MISLLIDTSNRPLSVALNKDSFTLAEINTTVHRNHSGTVMDYIDKLFKMTDVDRTSIDRIIVARGPGSYTGVRIGVTVAKTLAYALNVELYSVSSLFVAAASSGRTGIVAPAFDGRRGNVFSAVFNMKENNFNEIIAPQYVSIDDLKSSLEQQDSAHILIDGKEKFSDVIGDYIHVIPRITEVEKFEQALILEDIHKMVPEYLKVSEAERNWMAENQS